MEQHLIHGENDGPAGPVRSAGPDSLRDESSTLFIEFNRVAGPGRPDPSERMAP